jgi:hypothetical protein
VYVTRDDFLKRLARSGLAPAIKLGLPRLHNPGGKVAYKSFMIYPQIYGGALITRQKLRSLGLLCYIIGVFLPLE